MQGDEACFERTYRTWVEASGELSWNLDSARSRSPSNGVESAGSYKNVVNDKI